MWRGDPSLPAEQWVKVLGTALGHTDFLKGKVARGSNRRFVGAHRVCSGSSVNLASLDLLRPGQAIRFLPALSEARQGGVWTLLRVAENASWTSVSKLPHAKICKEAPFPAARTG